MGEVIRFNKADGERKKGHRLEVPPRGVLARLAQVPGVIISAVRGKVAKMAESTVMENPDLKAPEVHEEPLEAEEKERRLAILKEQYEALPEADRKYCWKVRSFEEVLRAVPNIDNFLAEIAKLEDGKIYFLSVKGELIIGDGCAEPLEKTLGWSRNESRREAGRISYVDGKGRITTIKGDDMAIPDGVKVLSERGLITIDEYKHVNNGQFENDKAIWMGDGKKDSVSRYAYWNGITIGWDVNWQNDYKSVHRGSRRVLRVKLDLKS